MTQAKTVESVTQKLPGAGSKRKWGLMILGGILVIAWFALGIHLHMQAVQGRAKVEQNRIERARRQEFMRRGVRYKQGLQERTQTPRGRNVFDGR